MREEVERAYDAVTFENKEKVLKNILRGQETPRRRPSRWKLIVANAVAAAAVVAAAIVLLTWARQPVQLDIMPLASGLSDGWVYYPGQEFGLFRVKEDGSQAEKLHAATEIAGIGEWWFVKDATAIGDWVYYSLYYNVGTEHTDLYRIKADGSGEPEPLLAPNASYALQWRMDSEWIYWSDTMTGLHKMRLDGSDKTDLRLYTLPEKLVDVTDYESWGHPFALVDGWIYFVRSEVYGVDPAIYRVDTNGENLERFFDLGSAETSYVMLWNFEGPWVYYQTAEDGAYKTHRVNTLTRESYEVMSLENRDMSFFDEFQVAGDWFYFPHCYDMRDWGSIYQVNMKSGEKSLLMEDGCRILRVHGDRIYYYTYNEQENWKPYWYSMKLDGTDRRLYGALNEDWDGPVWVMATPDVSAPDEPVDQSEIAGDIWNEHDEDVDYDRIVEVALAYYVEQFGDKPMVMYYVHGLEIGEASRPTDRILINFWVVWDAEESYCITVIIPAYEVFEAYSVFDPPALDSLLDGSYEESIGQPFAVKKIF
ncbi:MAG: DUF5050 domain-containing protein [Clostridiales bacterium]|nr:DUF5050 domain-containing protein [Clostridiales bacterium]